MDECKVIIMGFGSVGQGVANALSMKKDLIKDKTGVSVKVVAAADSSSSAISQDGLDEELLVKTKKETIISKQIVRSGTSIGANINEANYGQSKADFVSKMHIALKETAETEYWLKLLTMSEYITENMGNSLLSDCLEIKKILIASINTAKEHSK